MKKFLFLNLILLILFLPLFPILGQVAPQPVGPSIDIKVSTSTDPSSYTDRPISVDRGTRIYLKWQGQADFCYALGSWRGFRNPNGQTSYTLYRVGKYVYALVCASLPKDWNFLQAQANNQPSNLQNFVTFDYVEVNVNVPQPRVDLKINNSDGPVTLTGPANLILTWRTQYDSSLLTPHCQAEGPNWQGNKNPNGSERISVDLPSGEYNYTFTCEFDLSCRSNICPTPPYPRTRASDSVKVIVVRETTPPPTSTPPSTSTPTSTPTPISTSTPQLDVKVFDPQQNQWVDGPISLNVGSTTRVKWEVRNLRMYNRIQCSKYGDWSGNIGPQGEETVTISEEKTYTFGIQCSLRYICEDRICPTVYLPDLDLRDEVKVNGRRAAPTVSGLSFSCYAVNNPALPGEIVAFYNSEIQGGTGRYFWDYEWYWSGVCAKSNGSPHTGTYCERVFYQPGTYTVNLRIKEKASGKEGTATCSVVVTNNINDSDKQRIGRVTISNLKNNDNGGVTLVLKDNQPIRIDASKSKITGNLRISLGQYGPFGEPIVTYLSTSSTNPSNLVFDVYIPSEGASRLGIGLKLELSDFNANIKTDYGLLSKIIGIEKENVRLSSNLVANPSFTNGLNNWEVERKQGDVVEIKDYWDSMYENSDSKVLFVRANGSGDRTRVIQWVKIDNGTPYFLYYLLRNISLDSRQTRNIFAADEWCLGGRNGNRFVKSALTLSEFTRYFNFSTYEGKVASKYFVSGICDSDQDHRLAIFFDAFYNSSLEVPEVGLFKVLPRQ